VRSLPLSRRADPISTHFKIAVPQNCLFITWYSIACTSKAGTCSTNHRGTQKIFGGDRRWIRLTPAADL
jgi:hypothetical protein